MKLCRYLSLFFIASLFVSCSDDLTGDMAPIVPDNQVLTLSFESDRMLPQQVASRVSDPKEEKEKEIKTLHVFFFDESGNYLEGSYLTGYPTAGLEGGYCMPSVGATLLKIDRTGFTNTNAAKKATIVAVANVEDGWFPLGDDKRPTNVENLTGLREMVYRPKEIMLTIPESGMPMYGELTGKDLTQEGTQALIVELKALMARVDVNLTIDATHSDPSGLLPMLQMIDWTAYNVPTGAVFYTEDNTATGALGQDKKNTKVSNTTTLYNKNGELKLSFYIFENKQNKKENPDFSYPVGIKDDEKQRYKPEFANEDAAYVQIHGMYSTYNEDGEGGSTYDVTYKLYLGANHTDDYFVKRNCQYKNNVTIKGLIQAGNNPEHITFDTRVNVSQSNPFYVAMLRERDHDAHFCVTPMDVYMFDDTGESDNVKMTVKVENPDVNNWIRLEKVPAANMEAGTPPNDKCLGTGEPWHAGNGKRKYFTTSMMKAPDYDGLQSSVTLETSRDRVYVYLDEYLNDEKDREANLNLTYTAEDGSTINKTIKIVQAHLIKINVDGDIIYMEKYEEYLDHYDPLDKFNDSQLYPGLEWGVENRNFPTLHWKFSDRIEEPTIRTIAEEPGRITVNGFEYSAFFIERIGQTQRNLNQPPRSALEYCYCKNKRNDNGLIPNDYRQGSLNNNWYITQDRVKAKWFLPGIREMERAFTQQYNTFPEFQGNFYWSCSPSEKQGGTSGQDPLRARATKILPNGDYVQSGGEYWNDPNSGNKLRSTSLRIRAFRNDLNPTEY